MQKVLRNLLKKHTHTQKTLPLGSINKFSKVEEYKINKQKAIVFPHTCNEQSTNKIKKTIPWGTWLVQSVEYEILDLRVMSLNLHIGCGDYLNKNT